MKPVVHPKNIQKQSRHITERTLDYPMKRQPGYIDHRKITAYSVSCMKRTNIVCNQNVEKIFTLQGC
jgi:hypothetical protein